MHVPPVARRCVPPGSLKRHCRCCSPLSCPPTHLRCAGACHQTLLGSCLPAHAGGARLRKEAAGWGQTLPTGKQLASRCEAGSWVGAVVEDLSSGRCLDPCRVISSQPGIRERQTMQECCRPACIYYREMGQQGECRLVRCITKLVMSSHCQQPSTGLRLYALQHTQTPQHRKRSAVNWPCAVRQAGLSGRVVHCPSTKDATPKPQAASPTGCRGSWLGSHKSHRCCPACNKSSQTARVHVETLPYW